ncbi:MAG: hypothetical protein ACFE7E_07250 [Candidatus Hodarchaeota archaeon]
MGLYEIEKEMRAKRAIEEKAVELKLEKMFNELEMTKRTREKLVEIVKKYGILLDINPEFRSEVEKIRKRFGIPKSAIITQIVREEDVMKKGLFRTRVDHEKLGLLLYQRALMRRRETGGIMTIPEAVLMVNTGPIKGKISTEDVLRAIRKMEKEDMIPGIMKLKSDVNVVQFISVELGGDQNQILVLASEKGWITPEEIMVKTGWNETRVKRALEALKKAKVTRRDPSYSRGERYYFPGLGGKVSKDS